MEAGRIIYTDGHKVLVTNSYLQINTNQFRLQGIIKHGLRKIQPNRFPAVMFILMGAIIGVVSYFNGWPTGFFHDIELGNLTVPARVVGISLGGLLMITGVLLLGFLKELYALRIETAEGEKNVVVSSEEEYIQQILRALNRAINLHGSSRAHAL